MYEYYSKLPILPAYSLNDLYNHVFFEKSSIYMTNGGCDWFRFFKKPPGFPGATFRDSD